MIPSMLLLQYLTCGTLRLSVVVDFYHITAFLCNIRLFLTTHAVYSFEVTLLDDERCLVDDGPNLSGSLLNVLSHLSNHCSLLLFTARTKHMSRSLLNQWVPVHIPKPLAIGKCKGNPFRFRHPLVFRFRFRLPPAFRFRSRHLVSLPQRLRMNDVLRHPLPTRFRSRSHDVA